MRAHEFIAEALKPSQYRKYVSGWDKTRWADIFDNQYRIYIPLAATPTEPDARVISALKAAGYEVLDYAAGLAYKQDDPRQQPLKIGRIFSDTRLAIPSSIKTAFDGDPSRRSARSENMVVISRHPYDIAGMSTGRNWDSCMNIDSGLNRRYVAADVREGTIVAYLIRVDDRNIQNPLARILIKPFINRKTSDIALGVEKRDYGDAPPIFAETVVKWADGINASKKLNGLFKLNPRLYDDGLPSHKLVGNPSDEDVAAVLEEANVGVIQQLIRSGQVTDSVLILLANTPDMSLFDRIVGELKFAGQPPSPKVQAAWCDRLDDDIGEVLRVLFKWGIIPDEQAVSNAIRRDVTNTLRYIKEYDRYRLTDQQVEASKTALMDYYFYDRMGTDDLEDLITVFYKYGFKMTKQALEEIQKNGEAAARYGAIYQEPFPAGEPAMIRDIPNNSYSMAQLLQYVIKAYKGSTPEPLLDKLQSDERTWKAYNRAIDHLRMMTISKPV